jgi:hypothetical protein
MTLRSAAPPLSRLIHCYCAAQYHAALQYDKMTGFLPARLCKYTSIFAGNAPQAHRQTGAQGVLPKA